MVEPSVAQAIAVTMPGAVDQRRQIRRLVGRPRARSDRMVPPARRAVSSAGPRATVPRFSQPHHAGFGMRVMER